MTLQHSYPELNSELNPESKTGYRGEIPDFETCKILVVGDLMLDQYVWGAVDRISPEAPVQVVSVNREDYTLGGAGNVINNLRALGATVFAASVIGDGPDGDRMIEAFSELDVETDGIVREEGRLTTRKTRIIAGNQHVLRIDRETRKGITEKTLNHLADYLDQRIPDSDLLLLSDYAKGLLSPRFLSRIIGIGRNHGRQVICDPKGLDFTKYAGVGLLTPNRKEAAVASGIEIEDDQSLKRAAEKILSATQAPRLLITCGAHGMVCFERGKRPHLIPAKARQVFDVSGAGDTVISVLGLGLAAGLSFEEAAALANTAAGVVVAKVGTATVTREELASAGSTDSFSGKFQSMKALSRIVADLKRKGKRIVLTNGCFDLLHAGHILLFSASRKEGDVLIAAIDDDDAVRALKGPGRPVIGQKERIRILSALDAIDYVTLFSHGELENLIRAIRPDVLTKGSNYSEETVEGRALVESLGGRVVLIPLQENISASTIIRHIRNRDSG